MPRSDGARPPCKAVAWLLGAAVLATAGAGQVSTAPPPGDPATSTYLAGWLEEFVTGDTLRAIAIHEAAARNPSLSSGQRGQSVLRLIWIHALRDDDEALEKILSQLPPDVRTRVEDDVIGRIPIEVRDLSTALRSGEEPTDEQRAAAETSLEGGRSRPFWRRLSTLDTFELAGAPDRRSAAANPGGELRLRIPLRSDSWIEVGRARAAQIARLRLRDRDAQADLLEADIVDRLRVAGRTQDLGPSAPPDVPRDEQSLRLGAARRRLGEAKAGRYATEDDVAVMARIIERIDELEEAGRAGDALELLAELPYRGLLEDEPRSVDDHGRGGGR